MNNAGPWRPGDATPSNGGGPPPNAGGPPPGAGGPPRDAGDGKSGGSKGMVTGAIVVVALVVLGLAVFVGFRFSGGDSDDETVAVADAETTSEQADARAAECEGALIGTEGVTRVIDCGDGWAVLAREGADESYWVAYRDGGWTTVNNDSNYVMTCDGAIAQGVPAWMAARYVSDCTPEGDTRPPVVDPGNHPANKAGASVPDADPDAVAPPAGGDPAAPAPERSYVRMDPPDLEMAPLSPPQPHLTGVVPPIVASPVNPVTVPPLVTHMTRIAPEPPVIVGPPEVIEAPRIIGPPPIQVVPNKTPRVPRP